MKCFFIISAIVISGCCSYDSKDLEFTNQEWAHFSNYKPGDTIYFESNRGDVDTVTIIKFGTERNEKCGGFMAPNPINGRWIHIKHLPVDKWHGTSQTGSRVDTVYQEMFWMSKSPTDKRTDFYVAYRDFYSRFDTTIGGYYRDTLLLNDVKISNYYEVKHARPEKVIEPGSIEIVYWTDHYGLTAYKNKSGEIWIRKTAVSNMQIR